MKANLCLAALYGWPAELSLLDLEHHLHHRVLHLLLRRPGLPLAQDGSFDLLEVATSIWGLRLVRVKVRVPLLLAPRRLRRGSGRRRSLLLLLFFRLLLLLCLFLLGWHSGLAE
jgi:hypothetical protein